MAKIRFQPTGETSRLIGLPEDACGTEPFTIEDIVRMFGEKANYSVAVKHPLNREVEFTFQLVDF